LVGVWDLQQRRNAECRVRVLVAEDEEFLAEMIAMCTGMAVLVYTLVQVTFPRAGSCRFTR
jgi:hypothetical protein